MMKRIKTEAKIALEKEPKPFQYTCQLPLCKGMLTGTTPRLPELKVFKLGKYEERFKTGWWEGKGRTIYPGSRRWLGVG
jgi:hypothetical protein